MPQAQSIEDLSATEQVPLCVDLDGTLVKSDTLVDSLLVLIRTRPAALLELPRWLLKGNAAFKAIVTEAVSLDVTCLPYTQGLLRFLQEEHARGREIYLTTGANILLAQRVADHLGIFTGVLASDGATNLTGERKLDSLRSRFGSVGFDYIGNDSLDLPLLAYATDPIQTHRGLRLRMKLRARGIEPADILIERKPALQSLLKAIRPQQWAKNMLIFVPLLCSHAFSSGKLLAALGAFCCFSLSASSAYLINDLLDVEADRRHPQKRMREFAAGDLSALTGISVAVIFFLASLMGAAVLPGRFFTWLLIYQATTLFYSFYLKRIALVDVLVLSGLYSVRMLAGSSVTQTPISHWLADFSMFLFLSLAIAKRFAELENLRASNTIPRNDRGYLLTDLSQLRSFGTASAYAAVVIFAIYITGSDVVKLYRLPQLLRLNVPLIILWLNRVWLLASRGKLQEDPVTFALIDPASRAIGVAVVALTLLAI